MWALLPRPAPLLNDAECETRLGRGEKIAHQLASVGSRPDVAHLLSSITDGKAMGVI
jgi:hypothetical protein